MDRLHEKVLLLAAKFVAGGEEWWDNNRGRNYGVGFKRPETGSEEIRKNAPGM